MPSPDGLAARNPLYMKSFYQERQKFFDDMDRRLARAEAEAEMRENQPPPNK